MKSEPVNPEKFAIAQELVRKAFILAGVEESNENRSYSRLAKVITAATEVRISAKSIQEIANAQASDYDEYSFNITKSKEVLAAFVLLKEGKLEGQLPIKKKPDASNKQNTIAHNIYFERYYTEQHAHHVNTVNEVSKNLTAIEKELPSYFENTIWRFYSFNLEGIIHGYIIKIFAEKDGHLSKVTLLNATPGYPDYFGWAGLDSTQNFIIFHLLNKEYPQKYAHLMCSLNLGKYPTLILGILTYVNSTTHDLTATITALEKLNSTQDHSLRIYSTESPAPPEIIKLFSLKNVRLSPETKSVHDFHSLKNMLLKYENQEKERIKDEILASYSQKYWLYYMFEDDSDNKNFEISKIEFEIYISPDYGQIKAALLISKEEEYKEGIVTRNGSFISAYFHKPLLAGANARTAYLVFKVGEVFIPDKMECFLGIISGLSDDHDSAISYSTLIVPQSFKEISKESLIKFFSQREWRVESSIPKGFKFSNLGIVL